MTLEKTGHLRGGTRQEYNNKILEISTNLGITDTLELLIAKYPQQRFGQILCNYVCPDYRDKEVSDKSKIILNYYFPDWETRDPFFEESRETYFRAFS